MTTNARIYTEEGSHFYLKTGEPFYEVPYADPTKGIRKATLADARKVGALPGWTTIDRILNKPALNEWKTEQACLAILTTPKQEGESLDAFVHRVLKEEKVQDQESQAARDIGSAIHEALALAITGQPWDPQLTPFINPILEWQCAAGRVLWTEKILLGDGYAGRADCLLESSALTLVDWKTTTTVPKSGSYFEHRAQLAAYAKALGQTGDKAIVTCNVYISKKEPGKFAVFHHDDWDLTYEKCCRPMIALWQQINNYAP